MSATSACPFCGAEPGVACQGGQPTCADRIANEEGAAQRLAAGMRAATFHDWDGRAGDLADAPAKVRDMWFDAGRALLAYLRDRGRPQSIEDLVAFLRTPAGETSIQATRRALSRMPHLSDMEWAALPHPVRAYVEQIETIGDPAGVALENAQLRDQLAAMAARLVEVFPYEATLKDLADKLRTDGVRDRELLVFVNQRFQHWSPK